MQEMSKTYHHTGNVNTLKHMEMRTDWQAHLLLAINVSILWAQYSRFFQGPTEYVLPCFPSSHCKAKTATCHLNGWADCLVMAVLSVKEGQEDKKIPVDFFHLWILFWYISVSSSTSNCNSAACPKRYTPISFRSSGVMSLSQTYN